MKIAIIGDRGIPARYSGFSTLVEELAVRLVKDYQMDVTVYCRSNYYDDYPPVFKGVKCVYLPAPGGKSFESIIHTNFSIIHAIFKSYDLIFLLDPGNAPFSIPLILRGFPFISHTDGLGWKRQKWNGLQQTYYKWSEWVCARLSTWLVTDARAMQDYYIEEYKAPSTYIPYAGKVGSAPNAICLEKYNLRKKEYYLAVARLEPENNVDFIVAQYKAANPERLLVVVGGVPYQSRYAQKIFEQSDDKVICLGTIYDSDGILNGLYKNCYAYLHGHEVGGTNPSLLRAMHAGTACIPIDVVFHREVLGDQAMFFSRDDDSLTKIIHQLDKDPQLVKKLGELAKFRSERFYRWDAIAQGYARLFKKVHKNWKRKIDFEKLAGRDVYQPGNFFRPGPR